MTNLAPLLAGALLAGGEPEGTELATGVEGKAS
jgi:hypothetical protein